MRLLSSLMVFAVLTNVSLAENIASPIKLAFTEMGQIPKSIGVAGPFAGVHNGALLIAGGANFPAPTWETDKVWHDRIDVLVRENEDWVWKPGGNLERPTGYGAAVSTPSGVLCMGGNDANKTFDDVFLLQWDPLTETVKQIDFPSLPKPCAYGAATLIGNTVYVAGGQSGPSLDTAMNQLWSLDFSNRHDKRLQWQVLKSCPGVPRAFNITVSQHNGKNDCVYMISGRTQAGDDVEFLTDTWQYLPGKEEWTRRSDVPKCVMAAPAAKIGQSHLVVFGGADGSLFTRSDELKDKHPGFPKVAFAYDTTKDTWTSAGKTPANQVTTIAVELPTDLGGGVVIPSGEVRPRVRSSTIWRVSHQ